MLVDEDDYPKEDDGLPGPVMCVAIVLAITILAPVILLIGTVAELLGRKR